MKITLKKIIKAFVPYGLLVLRREISNIYQLKKDDSSYYNLPESTVEYVPDVDLGKNLVKISCQNYQYPFFLRNDSVDVGEYKSIIIESKYDCCVEREPDVIIDAGANIGLSVIYFANKYQKSKIIAIEPEDSNYKILEKNTEKYPNVHLIKAALWDSVGNIKLLDTGLGNNGFMVGTGQDYDQITTPYITELGLTDTVTIEKIMMDYSIETIDILKIDIEGAEKEVLERSNDWIGKVNAIIIELHERMKKGCEKAFKKSIAGFDKKCQDGEDVWVTKGNYIIIVKKK
jgi:FkbM family methyltransferase